MIQTVDKIECNAEQADEEIRKLQNRRRMRTAEWEEEEKRERGEDERIDGEGRGC